MFKPKAKSSPILRNLLYSEYRISSSFCVPVLATIIILTPCLPFQVVSQGELTMGPLPAVQDTCGGQVPRCVMCQKRCSPLFTFTCHVVCASCLGLLVSHRDPGDVIECPECHRMYPFTDQWQQQFCVCFILFLYMR